MSRPLREGIGVAACPVGQNVLVQLGGRPVVPPGDGSGREGVEELLRWVARHREWLTRLAPVIGLGSPGLEGALVAGGMGGGTVQVTLAYGSGFSVAGPYVEVRTYLGAELHVPDLAALLGEERDRLFEHAGIDEPDASVTGDAELLFDLDLGHDRDRLRVETRVEDGLWAGRGELSARLELGGRLQQAAVSVVARGVARSELAVRLIGDLHPFAARGETVMREVLERQRSRPQPPAPVTPAGLDGHEPLVALVLDRARSQGRQPARRGARPPVWGHSRAWEAAVLGQMRLAGQNREDANRAVTLMANHMIRLAESVPWWPEHRAAALAETIRYTAFDSDVASRPAQDAWRHVFEPSMPTTADPAGIARRRRGETQAWLDAWETWRQNRSQSL